MTVSAQPSLRRSRRSSRRFRIVVELTPGQIELLLFFAQARPVNRVRARTVQSLTAKGLIRGDKDSGVYGITELGEAVAATVRRVER
jgi:hypothetical protein